jgi:phosphatidylglycerophosphate synthase
MNEQKNNPARPTAIEGLSNRLFIHPASDRLAPLLARAGVHPNLVSMAGLAFGLAAAWLYLRSGHWAGTVAALACMLVWHVLDGADGQVARLTGKASPTGRVVDAIADYSVFILVYIALVYVSDPEQLAWAWTAAVAAGVSHVVQAALYELQREKYIAWTGADGPLPQGRTPQGEAWRQGAFWWLEWAYVRLQRLVGGGGIVIPGDRDSLAPPGSQARRAIASRYARHYAANVRRWGMLSANSHTLAIFAFMMLGWPLGYFLFEALAMNLALVVLLARTRGLDRSFTAELESREH